MKRILKVYRAGRFSPNSVERDRAIIDATGGLLASMGYTVSGINEEELTAGTQADIILTMARTAKALAILKGKEREGCIVINRPAGVEACRRSAVDSMMRENGLPAAPLQGNDGYWIKRGDEAAQCKDDVIFVSGETEKERILERFAQRGISDVVTTAHVKGDLIKFYGVAGTEFFRTFSRSSETFSKFGDEAVNGQAHGYKFAEDRLHEDAGRLAALTGTDVYGGDCIIRDDGSYAIIDFNDWPSFALCREDAAKAIANLAASKINDKQQLG